MVSSATYGCNDDYVGLALPMDINDMFHIRESAYFQQRISPPSEERKRFLFGDGDGEFNSLADYNFKFKQKCLKEHILNRMVVFVLTVVFRSVGDRPALPSLKQQFSISELIVCQGDNQNHLVGSEETGLQEHTEENCLYCVGASVLGYPTQPQINSTHPQTGEPHTLALSVVQTVTLGAEYNT